MAPQHLFLHQRHLQHRGLLHHGLSLPTHLLDPVWEEEQREEQLHRYVNRFLNPLCCCRCCWRRRRRCCCRCCFVFSTVPLSVPTSEVLLLRRSSRSPFPRPHPGLIPHCGPGDVRVLVGRPPKETLHCCRVTSVVSSEVCPYSTYAGHPLLCPLLTTMLAESD